MRDPYCKFVSESLGLEGLPEYPTKTALYAHRTFLSAPTTYMAFAKFIAAFDPDTHLKDERAALDNLRTVIHWSQSLLPNEVLAMYLDKAPFTALNGLSGRALWLKTIERAGLLQTALEDGFLRTFYRHSFVCAFNPQAAVLA